MYQRAIVHMDLDSFFVSVECLKDSRLKGIPLAIGGLSQRGVIASCSYEARKFGVQSAMPVKMAKRLCPELVVMRGDMDSYTQYSSLVTDIIACEAPLFEKSSIDEFYLDISGMDRYFGCFQWTCGLREKILKESGLPISFGLSTNKMVSKVGTGEAKPNGTLHIPTGGEKAFLSPLSVAKIPGVGKETYKRLSFMGVRTIRLLSEIPPQLLEREFGKTGRQLWEKANAIDETPVLPYEEQKSMSKEMTFAEDTLDLEFIRCRLIAMTESLAFELRQKTKLTSLVSVKLRYADFNTHVKQRKIAYTCNDRTLIQQVQLLFEELYQKRQLIRLVGIKFAGLVSGYYPIHLFEDTEEELRLLGAMDKIRLRFGQQAIKRAAGL
jgi:DNA polymerase IV